MSYQETRYLASFVTFLVTGLFYAQRVTARWQAGDFDGAAGLSALGASVLWFIGAMIAAGIGAQIVVAILRGIMGADLDMTEDERDRLIEHRAMNAAFVALSVPFLGAMVALVLGHGPVAAILIILSGFVLAGLVADAWRFALHRWGVRI